MKAQLKNTQMVEVDLPEYFSYTRWSTAHYCRLIGDEVADLTTSLFIKRSAESIVSDLADIDIADFIEITKSEFRTKLNEVVVSIIAEPATESN